MSVNYECTVVRGWKMTNALKIVFDNLTEFEYEDMWLYPNSYDPGRGLDEEVFFGEEICCIPCGTAKSFAQILGEMLKANYTTDLFTPDRLWLIQEAVKDNEALSEIFFDIEPQIYFLNRVF